MCAKQMTIQGASDRVLMTEWEIRTLRAMWRALEAGPLQLRTGHEEGTSDTRQGEASGHRASARPYEVNKSQSQRLILRLDAGDPDLPGLCKGGYAKVLR